MPAYLKTPLDVPFIHHSGLSQVGGLTRAQEGLTVDRHLGEGPGHDDGHQQAQGGPVRACNC